MFKAIVDFDTEIVKIIITVSESKEGGFRDSLRHLKVWSRICKFVKYLLFYFDMFLFYSHWVQQINSVQEGSHD